MDLHFAAGIFLASIAYSKRAIAKELPMLRRFALFAALPMVLSCAPFQQASANNGLNADQSSLVDAACTNVMGLRPGESYFANCRETLARSLDRKSAAAATVMAAADCRNDPVGSPAMSVCMLDEESKTGAGQAAAVSQPVNLAYAADTLKSGRSFYDVTPSVRWNRERYSCAQLGLMPNSGLFMQCVAGLEGAFLPDE
jgi:hypothetical protein